MRNNSEDEHDLGVDPCPDCDVRFNRETKLPIMAGTSILGLNVQFSAKNTNVIIWNQLDAYKGARVKFWRHMN